MVFKSSVISYILNTKPSHSISVELDELQHPSNMKYSREYKFRTLISTHFTTLGSEEGFIGRREINEMHFITANQGFGMYEGKLDVS